MTEEPRGEDLIRNDGPSMSEERFARLPDGVDICFQTFGSPEGEPLLLVMGLGGPMLWWPQALCERLAGDGFFVIRYDNRDTGRSTKLKRFRVTRPMLVRAFVGRPTPTPYTISDMARDGLGVLDELGIRQAHVAGVSMGGMIAQTMAIEHPDRVLSLTSIMSTTGRRLVGWQHPRLVSRLLVRAGRSREDYIAASLAMSRLIGSPAYRTEEEVARTRAGATFDRGISVSGVMRQMLAIVSQPDRTLPLGEVRVPTTVVHGLADRMVHVSGGRATARAIPGSELVLVPGMGHDLPEGLYETFVDAIKRSAARAGATRPAQRAR